MKNIFVWLLLNLIECGKVKSATMFDDTFSSFTVECEDGDYNINITKCIK